MSILICKTIECPYFEPSTKRSYGCQRYSDSAGCHLNSLAVLESSHYTLCTDQEDLIPVLRSENERFFREDIKLKDDLDFLNKNPDLRDCTFIPKPYGGAL
jgi:hypothetical protein